MARNNNEDITRFLMSNTQLKDASGAFSPEHLKDWNKQVLLMTKALESATNGVVKVVKQIDEFGNAFATFDVPKKMAKVAGASFDKVLGNIETTYGYQSGSLGIDPYTTLQRETDYKRITFHKDFHGAVAKRSAKESMLRAGGSASLDPSKQHQDRMKLSFDVSDTDWQAELAKTKGDVTKAKTNLARRFVNANLKDAERYSRDVAERSKEKDEKREEKEEKATRRKTLHSITLVITALTVIADISRRILTATLARASEIKRESTSAKSLGISYGSVREYRAQEKAMGLKEGAFTSAIGTLQSATGDISNLDTNMIKELAKVLQGDVIEAINNGLGKNDPERLLQTILDTYYQRGQNGVNSLGQQVGRYNAERELTTALEKAGLADVADILRNMFYTNDTGIYKGQIGTEHAFSDYMSLVTAYTNGLTNVDYKKASELGAVIDSLKKTFEDLKENLEAGLLISLGGIIDSINNWQIGKSASEKIESNITNKRLNAQAKSRMSRLSEGAKQEYEALFSKAGVNVSDFGITGVESLDDYLAWVNTSSAWGWQPKGDKATSAYQNMLNFIRTDAGQEALKALHYSQVTANLAKQAQEDNDKGIKTAKTEYKASSYTDTNIEYLMRGFVANTVKDDEYSAVSLMGKAFAGKNVESALTTPDKMYEMYMKMYGGFDYKEALKSGSSKNLTEELYKLAKDRYKDRYSKNKGKIKELEALSKQELVEHALYSDDKALWQADVISIFRQKAFKKTGYGLSQSNWELLEKAVIEEEKRKASDAGAQRTIISDALATEQAKSFLTRATADSKVKARVESFDEKKGVAVVDFTLNITGKDIKPQTIHIPIQTDSTMLMTSGTEISIPASMVQKALSQEGVAD